MLLPLAQPKDKPGRPSQDTGRPCLCHSSASPVALFKGPQVAAFRSRDADCRLLGNLLITPMTPLQHLFLILVLTVYQAQKVSNRESKYMKIPNWYTIEILSKYYSYACNITVSTFSSTDA